MVRKKEKKQVAGAGLCCPHCSDTKYPCVKMEKALKGGEKSGKVRTGK
jgi:hypothetical protein